MGMHPNTILMLRLKQDNLSHKTYRAILADEGIDPNDDTEQWIRIGNQTYTHMLMEDSYHDGYQISADEGDIVLFDHITYGYGDVIEWGELAARKVAIDEWSVKVCAKHHCTASVFITANYW